MGFLLLIPFFLIRFGVLSALGRDGMRRAAHFPPVAGWERAACWLYQLSTVAILLLILLSRVKAAPLPCFGVGAALYLAGLVLLFVSVLAFSAPAEDGVCRSGIYHLSRNPMYVAYFLLFLGCVLLIQSLPLLLSLAVFQLTAHVLIRAEERWCLQTFGEAYARYLKTVRRYL